MIQKNEPQRMSDLDSKFRIKNIMRELGESDAVMIRALEDLMIVLLKKKVISIDVIHPMVVEKIKHRRKLRGEMKILRGCLVDDDKK